MSVNHPYRSLQLPRNAAFELMPSPGKGWGAFATRPIQRGSLILRERALFGILESPVEIMECDIFAAFLQLSPIQKRQLGLLRKNGSGQFTSLVDILAENSFDSRDESLSHGVPITPGPFIELHAIKDIEAGEEIYFCYVADLKVKTKHERHEFLNFVCNCKACLPGTLFQELSDLRRRLIRGMLYITRGVDLDGEIQTSQSPVIVNPELKAAAEGHDIPLTSNCLLEEEGLLDDWAVKIVGVSVGEPAALFKSEYNRRIVKLAMAQDTWLKKFQVAFPLYGRADPADLFMTMLQRVNQVYSGGALAPWT
ncbi:hypothetical protein N7445_009203 [Penicillium cf. griseofulvum]|nr:hypothetical protein N7445_009203 [Penicillium cf. griseofulvum]